MKVFWVEMLCNSKAAHSLAERSFWEEHQHNTKLNSSGILKRKFKHSEWLTPLLVLENHSTVLRYNDDIPLFGVDLCLSDKLPLLPEMLHNEVLKNRSTPPYVEKLIKTVFDLIDNSNWKNLKPEVTLNQKQDLSL